MTDDVRQPKASSRRRSGTNKSLPLAQFIASVVFALMFFGVLSWVLINQDDKNIGPVKQNIIYVFCALFGGLAAGFFVGKMTLHTNWSTGKKGGISAAGGFAVFVLIWLTLTKTTGRQDGSSGNGSTGGETNKPKSRVRLLLGINRYELNGAAQSFGMEKFEHPGSSVGDISDETFRRISDWVIQVVTNACPQPTVRRRYTVSYQKARISPLALADRRLAGVHVAAPNLRTTPIAFTNATTTKRPPIPPLPPSLKITPQDDGLRVYYWLLGPNTKSHVLISEAPEQLIGATQPIILQFEEPGYLPVLAEFVPTISTNITVEMDRTSIAVAVGSEVTGTEGAILRLITAIQQNPKIKAFGRAGLEARNKALEATFALDRAEERNRKLAALRQNRVDFVVTVVPEVFTR